MVQDLFKVLGTAHHQGIYFCSVSAFQVIMVHSVIAFQVSYYRLNGVSSFELFSECYCGLPLHFRDVDCTGDFFMSRFAPVAFVAVGFLLKSAFVDLRCLCERAHERCNVVGASSVGLSPYDEVAFMCYGQ